MPENAESKDKKDKQTHSSGMARIVSDVWTQKMGKILSDVWTQKTALGFFVYFYLSAIGFTYDYVYYRYGYGLEILPYITVQDVAFSVLKHWMLIAVPAIVIPVTIIVLLLIWKCGEVTLDLAHDNLLPWLKDTPTTLKKHLANVRFPPPDMDSQASSEQHPQPSDDAPTEQAPTDQALVTTTTEETSPTHRVLAWLTKCANTLMILMARSVTQLDRAITRLAQAMYSLERRLRDRSIKIGAGPPDRDSQTSTEHTPPDQALVTTTTEPTSLTHRFSAWLTKCAKNFMKLMDRSVTQLGRAISFLKLQLMYCSIELIYWSVKLMHWLAIGLARAVHRLVIGLARAMYWLVIGLAHIVYWSVKLVCWLVQLMYWSIEQLARAITQFVLAVFVLVVSIALPFLVAVSIANQQVDKPLTATKQTICTKWPEGNCYKNAAHIGSTGTYAIIVEEVTKGGTKVPQQSSLRLVASWLGETRVVTALWGATARYLEPVGSWLGETWVVKVLWEAPVDTPRSYQEFATNLFGDTRDILGGLLSFPEERTGKGNVVVISKDNVAYFDVSGEATDTKEPDRVNGDRSEGVGIIRKNIETLQAFAEGSEALAKAVMANTRTVADNVNSTASLAKGSEALAKAVMANTRTTADTVEVHRVARQRIRGTGQSRHGQYPHHRRHREVQRIRVARQRIRGTGQGRHGQYRHHRRHREVHRVARQRIRGTGQSRHNQYRHRRRHREVHRVARQRIRGAGQGRHGQYRHRRRHREVPPSPSPKDPRRWPRPSWPIPAPPPTP